MYVFPISLKRNYSRWRNKRCSNNLRNVVFLAALLFSGSAFSSLSPSPVVPDSVTKNTYVYSSGTATFTPVAAATDMITIRGSNGTKTVRVISFVICPSATAAGAQTVFLVKRVTATTGGTAAAITAGKMDSNSATATAAVNTYSVNPTSLGTADWTIAQRVFFQITAGTTAMQPCTDLINNNSSIPAQPVTLRGTTELLALNNNGAALAAGYVINSWYAIVTEE